MYTAYWQIFDVFYPIPHYEMLRVMSKDMNWVRTRPGEEYSYLVQVNLVHAGFDRIVGRRLKESDHLEKRHSQKRQVKGPWKGLIVMLSSRK